MKKYALTTHPVIWNMSLVYPILHYIYLSTSTLPREKY